MLASETGKRWSAWIVLAAALVLGCAHADGASITVSGSGVVWAEPDQAVVEVGWSGVDPEAGTAVTRASEAIGAIRDALLALGIAEEDVRTTGYYVWREERWDEHGEPRLVGFRVSHTLHVVVRETDLVGTLITAAAEAGANQVGGITFTVSDRVRLEREARALAFAAAEQRARELADLSGLRLGPVQRVEELARGLPAALEALYDVAGRGGTDIATGRHAVEIVLHVTFAAD